MIMLLLRLFFLLNVLSVNGLHRAEWMSGQWGIGYRIHATPSMIEAYDVDAFIEQLATIEGYPEYVIVNLSGPANNGDAYLAYNPTLWSLGNHLATPGPDGRDLFGELLSAIHGEGLKVIAYMAAQGPALLKAGVTKAHDWNGSRSPAYENWVEYVELIYGNSTKEHFYEAYATDIIEYYSNHYGDQLDGWWFDQGSLCNRELVAQACRSGNPNAVIAFNYLQKVPLQINSPGLEDYTFGHPTPIVRTKSSSLANLAMVTSVENTTDGFLIDENDYESLAHLFMPMGNTWDSINYIQADGSNRFYNVWDEEQAVDWMSRVLTAGGAWTWNIPRKSNSPDTLSLLRQDFVDFLNQVVVQLPEDDLTDAVTLDYNGEIEESWEPLDCSNDICDHAGEYWSVCVVMDDILNQYYQCAPKGSMFFISPSANYCGSCDGYCAEPVKESDPCDDAHFCRFIVDPATLASQTCHWLAGQTSETVDRFCQQLDTREICPETCGTCSDSCEDDPSVMIVIDGTNMTCEFLAENPVLHAEVCDPTNASGAWEACAETCGNCNQEFVSPWITLDCSDHPCGASNSDLWSVCIVLDGLPIKHGMCARSTSWAFLYQSQNYCGPCGPH